MLVADKVECAASRQQHTASSTQKVLQWKNVTEPTHALIRTLIYILVQHLYLTCDSVSWQL